MIDVEFTRTVNEQSEQTIQMCYHCHKCTSGCPVADEMLYGPDRILRLIQLGERELLLAGADIWLCASCETCGTRCPNQIDIARVMDALRQMALVEGVTVAEPDAIRFHRLFLYLLQHVGRMHEATLLAVYLVWTRNLLDYLGKGVAMFARGKVPLIPRRVQAREEVKRIFEVIER